MTNITGIDIRKALLATRGRSSSHEDRILEVAREAQLDVTDPRFADQIEGILHNIEDPDFDNFNE